MQRPQRMGRRQKRTDAEALCTGCAHAWQAIIEQGSAEQSATVCPAGSWQLVPGTNDVCCAGLCELLLQQAVG